MRGNRPLILILSFMLCFSLCSAGLIYGATTSDLDQINSKIKNMKQDLNTGKVKEKNLNSTIQNLESKIRSTQSEINKLTGNIQATQAKINEALAELNELEKDMNAQNEALNARLRVMYKNGNIGFIDVLMNSEGISSFLTNMDRVKRIYENDKEALENLKKEHELIDGQRKYLLDLRASLEDTKNTKATVANELKTDKDHVADEKAVIAAQNKALEAQIDEFQAEADRMIEEIRKLQGGGDYQGGGMLWPVPTSKRISSPFGMRPHPAIRGNPIKMHTGIDIPCPSGTNIIASNAGKVIKSGYNGSYGYMVMVDHGGGIITLYAHNSSLLVGVGDTVTKGQTIAKAGSTGRSTGPHLHFEVRKNGDYVDPLGWVSLK